MAALFEGCIVSIETISKVPRGLLPWTSQQLVVGDILFLVPFSSIFVQCERCANFILFISSQVDL
jgi:hypothetical protein